MSDNSSSEVSSPVLLSEELNPRRLVLTPLLIRILALVAVMLLANIP